MACTGELPPNTRSGQSFIHDPKVGAGEAAGRRAGLQQAGGRGRSGGPASAVLLRLPWLSGAGRAHPSTPLLCWGPAPAVVARQVAGETEVKAQIKLRFITASRQPMVVIRSFQLTQARLK